MKVTTKTRLQYRLQHSLFVLLFLGCIGFTGWLSVEYNIRSDWTAGKRHSLSNDTLQLLKELPDNVSLRSYQPDEPALLQAITEILNRYQNNKANFSFKLINPDIFIQQAKTDNIERYGQTIIEYRGRQERINTLSEENITNALIRLHRNNKTQLLFITQHGERSIKDSSAIGYSQLARRLTDKGLPVNQVNLLQQTITAEHTVLVIGAVNQPLLASEQTKILQYIKEGGNLLWLQDPGVSDSQQEISSALEIEFVNGVIVDNNPEITRMLKLSHPAIIPILEYKRHPITEKMQYFTLFTSALALQSVGNRADAENQWIATDLLITSKNSWAETGDLLLGAEFNNTEDTHGPLVIGIAQQRQIKSATKMSVQRIVVIGDTDFLANNQLGQGANLDFILKTFNWLAEDDRLISIADKDAPDLQLRLSANTASITGIVFLILLPLLLMGSGGFIWRRRRRQ
ncbi:Gliding motility-associated ABC transporter substrate-binding protein GldG [hydrothermal vent metagenome]|uniref:Gliding motility-associated ABC transporter substrate-binding protein GldG n=1 Tax=hydrothermal vent metagenome TaxID=652676 RepID=A0A3B0XT37_9ZZZZ